MSSSSPYPPPDSVVKEAVVSGMAAYRKLVAENTSTLENPAILEQLAKKN